MDRKIVWTAVGTALLVLLLLSIGFLAFVYSGVYNVAATEPHTAFGRWTLDTVLERSVEERADEVEPPAAFDSTRIEAGFTHFRAQCVLCHGAPGMEASEFAGSMIPEPPALSQAVPRWSDAELFWIVRHGIKMSGMPAWRSTFEDPEIWDIVAFIRELPQMDSVAYARMEEAAAAAEEAERARQAGAAEQAGARTAAATVGMTNDLRFDPETVRIQAGETVTWRNTSDVVHTVTADEELANDPAHVQLPEGAEPFNSGNISPGESYSRTFDVAGTYEYFCIPHEMQGMVGTLIVEPAR